MPPLTAASKIEKAKSSLSLPVEPSARSVPMASCAPSVIPSLASCFVPSTPAPTSLPLLTSLAPAIMLASAFAKSPPAFFSSSIAVAVPFLETTKSIPDFSSASEVAF